MSIASFVNTIADCYSWIIIIYVLMSWIPHSNGVMGDIYRFFGKLCDPYLDLFKRLIPPIGGTVDVTPILALLVLQLGVRLITSLF